MILGRQWIASNRRNLTSTLRAAINSGVWGVGSRVKKQVVRGLVRIRQQITVLVFSHYCSPLRGKRIEDRTIPRLDLAVPQRRAPPPFSRILREGGDFDLGHLHYLGMTDFSGGKTYLAPLSTSIVS